MLIIPDWVDIGPKTTDLAILNQFQFVSHQIGQKMRDGEISVNLRFNATVDIGDWFAVLLRAEVNNPWQGGGYFVFVRQSGELAIRKMGTIEALGQDKRYPPLEIGSEHILRVNIDGNHLFASLDEELREGEHRDTLQYQSQGNVFLGCYRSYAAFRNVQFVNHDTIAFR